MPRIAFTLVMYYAYSDEESKASPQTSIANDLKIWKRYFSSLLNLKYGPNNHVVVEGLPKNMILLASETNLRHGKFNVRSVPIIETTKLPL